MSEIISLKNYPSAVEGAQAFSRIPPEDIAQLMAKGCDVPYMLCYVRGRLDEILDSLEAYVSAMEFKKELEEGR